MAIPLLSPLITSPTSPRFNLKAEINSVASQQETEKKEKQPVASTTSFKKWQHPAAPFGYEPAPLVPFVCSSGFCGVDRR